MDFRRNVRAVAELLLQRVDYPTRTTTPGWDWIMAGARIRSESTLAKVLRFLNAIGYLGTVAKGRSAQYTPLSSDEHSRWPGIDGGRVADRAVYVLCEPMTEEELSDAGAAEAERMDNKGKLEGFLAAIGDVEKKCSPNQNQAKRNPKSIREWASPTLKGYFRALSERYQDSGGDRTDLAWPRDRTTDANDEATARRNELNAARTLQWYAPALARLSTALVARMCAPFFRRGWTVNDILHAIDHRPDGSLWAHDAFHGALNIAPIFQHRMNAWRLNGQPVYSLYQRQVRDAQEARDRAIAVSRQRAVAPAEAPVGNFAQGIAMLRAALRLGTAPA